MTQEERTPSANDEHGPRGFTVFDIFAVLRRRWLPILLLTLLGVGLGALLSFFQPKLYTSSATAVVNPSVTDNPAAALSQDTVAKSRAVQYNKLAQSMLVAERAAGLVDFPVTPAAARAATTTSVPTGTSMIQVQVEWRDPQQAARLADAWIDALTEEADQLAQADDRDPQVQINRMLPAVVPATHSSPRELLNGVAGGALGLAAGLGLALILELTDRRVRGEEDLERLGLNPIGKIPTVPELSRGRRLLAPDANGAPGHFQVREALNELRINLQFMNPDDPPRIITVTSANPGDGKSTVAANLATTMAGAGMPVILVDADLRKPTVASTFGLREGAGLSDVIVGRAEFQDVVQRAPGHPDLFIVPAGQIPPNPTELLTSERFREAMQVLAEHHLVIVDAPPLLAVSDAAVVAARFHGALLVLDAASASRDELRQAVVALERVHAPVLGAVLNRVSARGKGSSYQYYRQEYGGTASRS